jgi:hypothetical protein
VKIMDLEGDDRLVAAAKLVERDDEEGENGEGFDGEGLDGDVTELEEMADAPGELAGADLDAADLEATEPAPEAVADGAADEDEPAD